jgi:hypothetical protein
MPSEGPQRDIAKLLASINVEPVKNAPPIPDLNTNAEHLDLEYERGKADLDHLKDHFQQRKKYARRILNLTYVWIIAVLGLLLLDGFGWRGFHLADSIILAALGTTTADIFGVLLIVMKYFFPSDSPPPKR